MKLYTMPGTCALAPNIVAVWANVDVGVVNLNRGEQRQPAYLAINPKGQVPALLLDDGQVITEALAIMRYLAAQSRTSDLNPQDPRQWAKIDEALSYFTSEIHSDFGGHFAPQRFARSDGGQDEVRTATYLKLREHLLRVEATLKAADGDWYLGSRSIADAYLFVILRWVADTPISLSEFPELRIYLDRVARDAGVSNALHRQGMT